MNRFFPTHFFFFWQPDSPFSYVCLFASFGCCFSFLFLSSFPLFFCFEVILGCSSPFRFSPPTNKTCSCFHLVPLPLGIFLHRLSSSDGQSIFFQLITSNFLSDGLPLRSPPLLWKFFSREAPLSRFLCFPFVVKYFSYMEPFSGCMLIFLLSDPISFCALPIGSTSHPSGSAPPPAHLHRCPYSLPHC